MRKCKCVQELFPLKGKPLVINYGQLLPRKEHKNESTGLEQVSHLQMTSWQNREILVCSMKCVKTRTAHLTITWFSFLLLFALLENVVECSAHTVPLQRFSVTATRAGRVFTVADKSVCMLYITFPSVVSVTPPVSLREPLPVCWLLLLNSYHL